MDLIVASWNQLLLCDTYIFLCPEFWNVFAQRHFPSLVLTPTSEVKSWERFGRNVQVQDMQKWKMIKRSYKHQCWAKTVLWAELCPTKRNAHQASQRGQDFRGSWNTSSVQEIKTKKIFKAAFCDQRVFCEKKKWDGGYSRAFLKSEISRMI